MGFKNFSNKTKVEGFDENKKKSIEEIYNTYKDKQEDELLAELFKNINKQKQNGTFDYNGLVSAINNMSPFLSNEQSVKIKEILEKIR